MVLAAVLIAAALFVVDRFNSTARRFLLACFAGFMLWRFLDSLVTYVNAFASQSSHKIYFWDPIRNPICIAILAVSLICAWFAPRFADRMIDYVRLMVAASAFAIVAILPHLVRAMTLRPAPQGTIAVNHDPSLPGAAGNRIIWIMFDELSYDQTFDHPQPGIILPALDRLRAESFDFSNVKPAGYYTEQIIPSAVSGRADRYRSPHFGWATLLQDEGQSAVEGIRRARYGLQHGAHRRLDHGSGRMADPVLPLHGIGAGFMLLGQERR